MKTNKIEKLEVPDLIVGNVYTNREQVDIINKINEIISVLNSWIFEPTLTIPSQSQKQPEEKCIHYFPLSSEGVCQKCGIKFEDIKSEKQEEWRKEWRKLSFEIGSITKHQADEIEGFISERIKEAREEGRTDVLERLERG